MEKRECRKHGSQHQTKEHKENGPNPHPKRRTRMRSKHNPTGGGRKTKRGRGKKRSRNDRVADKGLGKKCLKATIHDGREKKEEKK